MLQDVGTELSSLLSSEGKPRNLRFSVPQNQSRPRPREFLVITTIADTDGNSVGTDLGL